MRPPVLMAGVIGGFLRPPLEYDGCGCSGIRAGGRWRRRMDSPPAASAGVAAARLDACSASVSGPLGASGLGIGPMSACAVEFSARASTKTRQPHRQNPRIPPQYGRIVSRQPRGVPHQASDAQRHVRTQPLLGTTASARGWVRGGYAWNRPVGRRAPPRSLLAHLQRFHTTARGGGVLGPRTVARRLSLQSCG